MSQTRQLAAIMFTDIVGYTALMGTNERKAFECLKKNREIQRPAIEQFNGKWIKELGDGVLACFNNASDAIQAAISIQERCNATGEFQLRIGIHQGDVVFEGGDVFGDAVNIASRIQCAASPGGIFISESVHQNVSSLQGIATRFVKQDSLKNVREPLNIYQIMLESLTGEVSSGKQETFKKVKQKSIAVLPFANMSNDPEQDYFGEGIAEEIINSLVHIRDLKIAGRTSSAQFKGMNIDLREVGKKLGVNTVLEGSVRKQGNHLRITAQLINVEDGFHLWSARFDRNMDDIFAIQDEIALAITKQLKITLFEEDRDGIFRGATNNIEAYELVLKGRFHLARRGSSIIKGLQYYEQAIAADPQYALAYSGYAWANYLMAFYSFIPGKEVMEKVKKNAEKAVELDDRVHEGYLTLAFYYNFFQWNWSEGKNNCLKAIRHNPQFAQGNSLYGMSHLAWVEGAFEEAQKYCSLGIKADPLSAIDHADLAWMLYTAKKYEDGLATARTGIELDANSFLSHRLAGLCLIALNRSEEAVEAFNHLMSISNRHQHALCGLIWAYCANDQLTEAQKLMGELIKRGEKEYIAPTHAAISAAHLNQIDLALEFLEAAFRDIDPILVQLKYSPFVPQALRANSRFQEMVNRMKFPD